MKVGKRINGRVGSESGATFVEYALLIGLVAVGVAVAVGLFGDRLVGFFTGGGDVIEGVETEMRQQDLSSPGSDVSR